jgi:rubrerythrin
VPPVEAEVLGIGGTGLAHSQTVEPQQSRQGGVVGIVALGREEDGLVLGRTVWGLPGEGSTGTVDVNVLERVLSECWAGEVSGVSYYEALGERFPDHRQEFDVLALVEKTTRDLIEAVARRYGVSIDQGEAERIGIEAAQSGNDWGEVLESALAYSPDTLRMFTNLADALPEEESALGLAVVEHERAQIVLFECAATGRENDWSAIDAFLEQQGARPHL